MADSAAKDEKDEDDSARRVEREEKDLALVKEFQLECGSSQGAASPQQQTLRSESREARENAISTWISRSPPRPLVVLQGWLVSVERFGLSLPTVQNLG